MAALSDSVRLKLDRANEHADSLERIVTAWSKPQPYRFATEVEEDPDGSYLRLRYLIEVFRPLPSDTLSKVFGDCIHNYRCVLDHLIWELSVAHSGANPPRPMGIKFPGRINGGGLHAVDPVVVTEVQSLHRDFA